MGYWATSTQAAMQRRNSPKKVNCIYILHYEIGMMTWHFYLLITWCTF